MSAPGKVVFLDIDGPVIPSTMYLIDMMCSMHRKAPATTIAVVNELCERTEARIVFNTTHNRPFEGVPNIDDALVAQGLNPAFLHPTDRHTRYPEISRKEAVNEWLQRHPEVWEWVALDDAKFTDDERLILVDADAGLHLGHLNAAIDRLGGKQVLILI